MTGRFVISLDFELMWGVRDRRSVKTYGDAILGARAAIPLMLRRFEAAGIRATWATVGLLFARSRQQMHEYSPGVRARYRDARLCPYRAVSSGEVGADERSDPFHFAASLIDRIAQTPGQEIATHTYGHAYCLEPGQTIAAFRADLASARAIAVECGLSMRSIVFPRNQIAPGYVFAARNEGFSILRGPASGWVYRSVPDAQTTRALRAVRFADGALPLIGQQVVHTRQALGGWDVPASRFLRPWTPATRYYSALHIKRICAEMTSAARERATYHLWWHPHNFGRHTGRNLAQLDRILTHYKHLRDTAGFRSASMQDAAVELEQAA